MTGKKAKEEKQGEKRKTLVVPYFETPSFYNRSLKRKSFGGRSYPLTFYWIYYRCYYFAELNPAHGGTGPIPRRLRRP
jgi:hypothetical protein